MDKHLKIIPGAKQRLDFGHFVDRLFWAMLVGIGGYTAKSINDLNEKVAVVIEHMNASDKRADAQDKRIERLEESVYSPRKIK